MAKTPEIRAAKGDAKEADRHNLGDPVADAAKWVRGLTTKRVSDLFKTEKGLEGHWKQVQQEVTRGNKHFFATKIDFPLQEMKFTSDMAWLKLEKASGKVKVKSTPGTKK